MRIAIHFDSASTEAVREIAAALNAVGLTAQLSVGLNGPEAWCGQTPNLTPNQFAMVTARLVKLHGAPIDTYLAPLR